ncbi:MAG: efflux RND transporter periplasmic adaptor subunit [Bacteroidales bacterium]|nr:efflux RND transporter periplasmic adaptor subunit [Bacteroidales bacterium]
MKKVLLTLFSVLVVMSLGIIVYFFRDRLKLPEPQAEESVPVPVAVMKVGLCETLSGTNYVGMVEPSRSAVVANQFPGTVRELVAVKGRQVRKGDVIAKVYSETVSSAYDIAKATLEQAEDGYGRAEKVYGTGSITEVKMVEVRTQLEKARAAEKSARKALEDCVVRAPFSGIVGEVYVHGGENVIAAQPLVQIIDVESVEIHFSVPESEYARISLGARADVEIPALEKHVGADVAVKGVNASRLSHAYDFTLKNIDDTDMLMPGMVCKVRLYSANEARIVIPASAVMTDMDGRYIWGVSADDTVVKTYVRVGDFAGDGVVILSGLEEGDRIIVEGSRKVSTGMKVKVEER